MKDKNAAIKKYKEHSFAKDLKDGLEQDVRLLQLREHVQRVNRDSEKALNLLLLDEFKDRLKIKFEQTSPPQAPSPKLREGEVKGKTKKRQLTIEDMTAKWNDAKSPR